VSFMVDTNTYLVSNTYDMNVSRRTYTMRARAAGVERTREDILAAVVSLTEERATFAVSLADVAERAGVTIRTVLRHFGSREILFESAMPRVLELVAEEREAPVGDLAAAARVIVDHYERRGDRALRMLEEASLDPVIARITEDGRRLHREWVRTVFAPQLARARDRQGLEDMLVVATDVYSWKLLRRDFELGSSVTEQRIHTMIRRLAEEGE
jgi:AcrR family transcriptional regulator